MSSSPRIAPPSLRAPRIPITAEQVGRLLTLGSQMRGTLNRTERTITVADETEIAFELAEARVQRSLAAIAADLPAGVSGECEECGEQMPRLVGGRCGFCRDGRRPPLSFYEAQPAPLPVVPPPFNHEETTVTDTTVPAKQAITMPCEGKLVEAIHAKAKEADLPLGRAAMLLLEQAMLVQAFQEANGSASKALDEALERPAALADASTETLHASIEEMLGELARRADTSVDTVDYDAAVARAEAAEAKLATLRAALAA